MIQRQVLILTFVMSLVPLLITIYLSPYLQTSILIYFKYTLIQFLLIFTGFIVIIKILMKINAISTEVTDVSIQKNMKLVLISIIVSILSSSSQFIRGMGHPFIWQEGPFGDIHHDVLYRIAQASMLSNHQVLSTGIFATTFDFGHRLSEIFLAVFSSISFTEPLKIYFLFQSGTLTTIVLLCFLIGSYIVNKRFSVAALVCILFGFTLLLISHINYHEGVRLFNNPPQTLGLALFVLSFSLNLRLISLDVQNMKHWYRYIFVLTIFSMLVIFSKIHLGFASAATLCTAILLSKARSSHKLWALSIFGSSLLVFGLLVISTTFLYGTDQLAMKSSYIDLKLFLYFILACGVFFYFYTKKIKYALIYFCFTFPIFIPVWYFPTGGQSTFFMASILALSVLLLASVLPQGIYFKNNNQDQHLIYTDTIGTYALTISIFLIGLLLYTYPVQKTNVMKYTREGFVNTNVLLFAIPELKDVKNTALLLEYHHLHYQIPRGKGHQAPTCRYPFLIYQSYLKIPVFINDSLSHIEKCKKISAYGVYSKQVNDRYEVKDICKSKEIFNFNSVIRIDKKGNITDRIDC